MRVEKSEENTNISRINWTRLKKSNEMPQYADIYLLLNYSICIGCPSLPSSEYIKLQLQPLVQIILSGEPASSNVIKGGIVWSVLEAATTVLYTPDDGRDGRPKHVE